MCVWPEAARSFFLVNTTQMSVPPWHRSRDFQTVEASQLKRGSCFWSQPVRKFWPRLQEARWTGVWLAAGQSRNTKCPRGRVQLPVTNQVLTLFVQLVTPVHLFFHSLIRTYSRSSKADVRSLHGPAGWKYTETAALNLAFFLLSLHHLACHCKLDTV